MLIRRPGWSPSAFFDPFHEHLIAAPALIYKVLQATFGMTSAVPYYVVAMIVFAIAAALLFAFLRVRVGEWLAFAAILPVLFLGAASEDLLWAFQVGFFGSVAAGLGALVALDRGDRPGDWIATVLVVVALAFGSVGIPFAVAAVVDVLLGPRPRRDRAFLALVPIAVYALWWIGWGHQAHHHISVHNIVHLPSYVFDAAGAGFAALLGQDVNSDSNPGHPPVLFLVIAALAAIALVAKIVRERRVSRGLAVALAILFALWILAGLDRTFDRPPISSRFQYPSAVFILIVVGEALRDVRLPRVVSIAVVAVAVAAMLGGISMLHRERVTWLGFTDATRSVLAAVELAGPAAHPDYFIEAERVDATVAQYRDAVGRFGSPAYGERELLEHADLYGLPADQTLIGAVGTRLMPVPGHRPPRGCRPIDSRRPLGVPATVGSIDLVNRSSAPIEVRLGRFAETPQVTVGTLRPATVAALRLPRGASPRPWHVAIEGAGVEACGAG